MAKYRIVSRGNYYVIQYKDFWGWHELKNISDFIKQYSSIEEAENEILALQKGDVIIKEY